MQNFLLTVVVTAILSGCSLLGVYKIDVPQGTPLTQAQVSQIKLGMTQQQVRYYLGSPTLTDTLSPNRWDYLYYYTPGTDARRAKIAAVTTQKLSLQFNTAGQLDSMNGQDSMPEKQIGLPASKDPIVSQP